MVRWVAFAGVVSVLVTLLLALTRSSAAAVRETGSGDDRTGEESNLTRVRGSLGDSDESGLLGDSDESGLLGDSDESGLFGGSDERGLLSPLPWRSADDPENPLSGPGGTELTTLDESDYPDPPPEHARPDEPTTESPNGPPDPSEAFPISGEAEYTDPDLPATDGRADADSDTGDSRAGGSDTVPADDTDGGASDDPADTDPAQGEPTVDDPLSPSGEPLDRTGRGDRWDGAPDDRDRWAETDNTPEDRWGERPTDDLDEVRPGAAADGTADDDTAAGDLPPTGDDPNTATDDTETATEPRPGVATAAADATGVTPGAFDGPDPFAGETDGFDPQLPAERDGVRVGDRELSTTVLLANVVGSQLLFAGLLVAVTVWAAVPAPALGLGSVTLPQVGVGALLGVALWVASESGGRLSRRLGIDPAEALRGALAPTTRREWWLLLGVVLPVVAVFEELLFRAALVGAFAAGASATGLNVPVAVFVVGSAVVFGLAHSAQGRVGMAVTGLLGVVLATAFVLTDSLVVVVVAHYVVNAAEFVVHEGPVSQFPE